MLLKDLKYNHLYKRKFWGRATGERESVIGMHHNRSQFNKTPSIQYLNDFENVKSKYSDSMFVLHDIHWEECTLEEVYMFLIYHPECIKTCEQVKELANLP